jgi:uncharacterized membrane protein YeiH
MDIETLTPLLTVVDLSAATVFAITGALVASRKQMDIIGFMWLGVVTGVGGGTVRDLLLGMPVFWVVDPSPVVICLIAAVIVHFTSHLIQSRYVLLLWLDAFGMALVTVAGTAKGLDNGTGPLIAVVMGVITASVGGINRDILGQEPSIILRREIYVTASVLGACTYVAAFSMGGDRIFAAAAGLAVAFLARIMAITLGWSMPVFRSRPGRSLDEINRQNGS